MTQRLRQWSVPRLVALLAIVLTTGCRSEMIDQPRYEPMEPSSFFEDGLSARPLVAGTIPRGWDREDEHLYYGRVEGQLAKTFPFPLQRADLKRGRDLYNTFCLPCHGATGDGQGMIVRRGFPEPPSFHSDRLRDIPVGHYFDVMTRGYGAMYSYAYRIKPRDRWKVAGYIRALQRSQYASFESLPEADRQAVEGEGE